MCFFWVGVCDTTFCRQNYMVILIIYVCAAFSVSVDIATLFFLHRLVSFDNTCACTPTMINESERLPEGWDQVQQDLTLQETLNSFPTHSINPSLCTFLCFLCRAIHLGARTSACLDWELPFKCHILFAGLFLLVVWDSHSPTTTWSGGAWNFCPPFSKNTK